MGILPPHIRSRHFAACMCWWFCGSASLFGYGMTAFSGSFWAGLQALRRILGGPEHLEIAEACSPESPHNLNNASKQWNVAYRDFLG